VPRALAALAVLLAGCGAVAPAVPVVEIAAPAAPEPEPAAEDPGEASIMGTYPRYAIVNLRNGEPVETNNATGTSTLKIEHGHVIYEQRYLKSGRERHVTQVYTFNPGALRKEREAYDLPLVHRSMRGDVSEYSPDSGSPRLLAHKRPWGWDIVLLSVDTSDVIGGHAFGAAPPGTPAPDLTDYARGLGKP
jgi:hypothetical protein